MTKTQEIVDYYTQKGKHVFTFNDVSKLTVTSFPPYRMGLPASKTGVAIGGSASIYIGLI